MERSCTENDVKKAYKKLALALHPDKNGAPGADEAFKSGSLSVIITLFWLGGGGSTSGFVFGQGGRNLIEMRRGVGGMRM